MCALVERRITSFDPGFGHELGQGLLVAIRTLAQIDGREMEPEDLDGTDQAARGETRREPRHGDR